MQRVKNDVATSDKRDVADKITSDDRNRNDELTKERRVKADKTIEQNRLRNDNITVNRRGVKDRNKSVAAAILLLIFLAVGTFLIFS